MRLTDVAIRRAISTATTRRKLSDGAGLHLLIDPPRQPAWRLKYKFQGREKLISLGVYRDVPLRRAREKCIDARRLLADGVDPSAERQAQRAAQAHSFRDVAEDWLTQQRRTLAPETVEIYTQRLTQRLYPAFGRQPIAEIKAPQLLAVLRTIEGRGRHETAHRVRALFGRVARFAIATGRAERDISADLRGALAPVATSHFAALTDPRRIGDLLRAIDAFHGQPSTMYALKLAAYVFVRPGELRAARWAEFDLSGREPEWRIPAERMKMKVAHLVPLARQVVALLRALAALTGDGELLFPSVRAADRPISDGTLNGALRRMGFSAEEMTTHGFRTIASTRLNELGFAPDVIERQLAHAEANAVRDAYNRALRLPERRKMMQAWADELDRMRAVTP